MIRKLVLANVILLSAAPCLLAQSTYGTLLGTVKDSSGAVIPSAQVTVTQTSTNISKATTTNSQGDYTIPNLLPGTYDVATDAPGFDKSIKQGVLLDPRALVRTDFAMTVGSPQTSVTVEAKPPVITTDTATLTDVQDNRVLQELPTNYRATDTSPLSLIQNMPGVQSSTGYSISGDSPVQNQYSVDGLSSISIRRNGPDSEMFPSSDAIQQVKVMSAVAPAEYDQMNGVDFTTKGGTNTFHGSLFEYFQNNDLNAKPDFAASVPGHRSNDFGGSVGGPVLVPHYSGKNRTFFFFDYEGNRNSGESNVVDSVPTQAMRMGDLSGLCSRYDSSGLCSDSAGTQVTNPFTGNPFPMNQISASLISPVATNTLKTFYPLPNAPNGNATNVTNNYLMNDSSIYNTNLFDIRVDQQISQRQSIFARYGWKHILSSSPNGLLQGNSVEPQSLQSVVVSHNFIFSDRLLNEARFGFTQNSYPASTPKFPNGAALIQQLGLQGLGPFPSGSAIPYFEFDGSSGVSDTAGGRQYNTAYWQYNVTDDLTRIVGRHTLKFGVTYHRFHFNDTVDSLPSDMFGNFYFNGGFSGNDYADFLLGVPYASDSYNLTSGKAEDDMFANQWDGFAQDSFNLTPRLTVNYGLRYEYHGAFFDNNLNGDNLVFNKNDGTPVNGGIVVPNQTAVQQAALGFRQGVNACGLATPNPTSYGLFPCTPILTASEAGLPKTLRNRDWTTFLPRAGFAYRFSDKTVHRAGAGMYNQTSLGVLAYSNTGNHDAVFTNYTNSITNGVPAFQFPNTGPAGATTVVPAGNTDFATAVSTNFRNPYIEQWALTLERDLGWETALRLSYIGTHAVKLAVYVDENEIRPQSTAFNPAEKPYPNWARMSDRLNIGGASFNGLVAAVTHRFGSNLYLQSSWTWDKNLSDGQGDLSQSWRSEAGPGTIDRYNLRADYGNVANTRRDVWLTTSVWTLPFGRGQRVGATMNPVLDRVLGGWNVSNIVLWQSGLFLTPYYTGSLDPAGTNAPDRYGAQRPDRLPASACVAGDSKMVLYKGNCFSFDWPGPIGRYGNSGVGILTGPGTVNWNAGLSKKFALTEKYALRFDATATNVANHPNLGNPNMVVNSSRFGKISSSSAGRVLQLALRLDF